MPDILPLLGYTDDALVLVTALRMVSGAYPRRAPRSRAAGAGARSRRTPDRCRHGRDPTCERRTPRPRGQRGRRPLPAGPAGRRRQDLHARAEGGAGLVRRAASRGPAEAARAARPRRRRCCSPRRSSSIRARAAGAGEPRPHACRAQPRRRGDGGLDKALALAPDSFETINNRGNVLLKLDRARRSGRGVRARAGARAALPRRARQSRQCAGAARPFRGSARALRRGAGGAARASRDASQSRQRARRPRPAATRRLRPTTARWRCAPTTSRRASAAASRWRRSTGIRRRSQEFATRARRRQEQRRRPAQRGAVAADARRLSPRLREIRGALAAQPACRAAAASASRSGSANIRSRARPSSFMPSRGSATPSSSRAMCRSWRAAAPRWCWRCSRSWSRCCRASRASRAWSRAATRCRLTMCIVPPAACRWRCAPTLRAFRPNVPYLAADEERVAKWRERIGQPAVAAHRGRLVGQRGSRQRPQPLDRAGAACAAVRCGRGSFVSIQRELRGGDAEALARLAATSRMSAMRSPISTTPPR